MRRNRFISAVKFPVRSSEAKDANLYLGSLSPDGNNFPYARGSLARYRMLTPVSDTTKDKHTRTNFMRNFQKLPGSQRNELRRLSLHFAL